MKNISAGMPIIKDGIKAEQSKFKKMANTRTCASQAWQFGP